MLRSERSPLASAAANLVAEDWDLSMEEMDSIERNAAQELATRRLESPLKSHPELLARAVEGRTSQQKLTPPVSPFAKRPVRLKVSKDGQKIAVEAPYNTALIASYKSVAGHEWDPNRRLWLFPDQNLQDVLAAVTGTPDLVLDIQMVPPLVMPPNYSGWNLASCSGPGTSPQCTPTKSSQEKTINVLHELLLQVFLLDDNRIAVRCPFNQNVKQACQSVTGRIWNNEEKMWTFPLSSLMELAQALRNVSHLRLKVEAIPPLVFPDDQNFVEHVKLSPPNQEITHPTPPVERDKSKSEIHTVPTLNKSPAVSTNLTKQFVKLFLHSSGYVALKCEPSQKVIKALKSITKAIWNHKERLWLFPPASLPDAEKALAEVPCEVESFEPLVRRALDFQRDLSDLSEHYNSIPAHLESNLFSFQQEGVRFALQHGGRALIADEMGLGKTVQALALATCLRDSWPVLVIVPSSLRIHWATMIKTWLNIPPSDITVVLSHASGSTQGYTIAHSHVKNGLRLDGLFNIVSYDMVSKLPSDLQFQFVIADESHYIKNAQAKRTNACVPLIQKSRYAVLLTGTPALSRPIELFKQLEALQPSVYVDVHEYGQRYCVGSYFGLYQGSSNREELHALLKGTVMIRRLKDEVLSELPDKCREQVFLSLNAKNTRPLRALLNELKNAREKTQSCEGESEKWQREEKILVTKIYAESSVAKVPAVQEYISTLLEADCKFLVFAHHHSMMDGVEEHLKKKNVEFIRIDGETPPLVRQTLVDKFQYSEKVKVALLSIRAAGVGITLTAASTVVFAEMSWTPGDLVQAEDRAHRIGQKSSVNVYYLHAHDTIDDIIWESIHRKLGNLGQVLNGRKETMRVQASPSQQRQKTLDTYVRSCSRNLSQQYEQAIPSTVRQSSINSTDEKSSKRFKPS